MKNDDLRLKNLKFLVAHFGGQSALSRALSCNSKSRWLTQQKISSILSHDLLGPPLARIIERNLLLPKYIMDRFSIDELLETGSHLSSLTRLDQVQKATIEALYRVSQSTNPQK